MSWFQRLCNGLQERLDLIKYITNQEQKRVRRGKKILGMIRRSIKTNDEVN